ncbi:NAD(P)H-dependent oxidoreductase [Streptomyces sp. MAR4 CNX-425]|uniref:NAD(P)H-dependent oxidoreductase n=1 Tax=Streptomyces sp. MAR4 CNX-425 TaxID=3406343 RepID=UPI003B510796
MAGDTADGTDPDRTDRTDRADRPDGTLRLTVLGGLVPGRAAGAEARRLAALAGRRARLEVDLIDLAAACLPEPCPGVLPGAAPEPPAVRELRPWLDAADGFVVVAPAPAAAPPHSAGPLRRALVWCAEAFKARPVALHVRAGEGAPRALRALRADLAEAHALTVHETDCPDGALDELVWWARALRTARATHPYPF